MGNGDIKTLVSICEKDCMDNSIRYIYAYTNEQGGQEFVGNDAEYRKTLGEIFDRKQLDRMECLERFQVNHGDFKLHTVSELGIRKCLSEWHRGVEYFVSAEGLHINIHTGKTEYIYSIQEKDDNIYCGCSYNLPFELGVHSYGQFFRLRNYQDNSQDFCNCYFDFDYKMPKEIKELDYVKLGGNTDGESCGLYWFVKRYSEDEIVLDGCGPDEYIYRKDECQYERFM